MVNNLDKNFRILFITQDDPFYVKIFFEEFFKTYTPLHDLAGVVLVNAMGKSSKDLARQMFDFYGAVDFLRVGARYATYKILAHTPFALLSNRSFSLKQLCGRFGIPVFHGRNINSKEFLDEMSPMGIDLIISVAAPVIFKEPLIRLPKKGCINIHNGMLPRYRGMLPNFWQMYHGEEKVGITVHEINSRLDDGRIIVQDEVQLLPEENLDSLIKRTKKLGAKTMAKAIFMIKRGTISFRDNSQEEGSYFSFPTKNDVLEFKRRGKRLL